MLAVLIVAVFLLGVAVGVVVATRSAPRLIARMPAPERLELARKVNRLARR